MEILTPTQARHFDFIQTYQRENRVSPSIGDISEAFGINKWAVLKSVRVLERKKAIERDKRGRILFPEAAINKKFLTIHG